MILPRVLGKYVYYMKKTIPSNGLQITPVALKL